MDQKRHVWVSQIPKYWGNLDPCKSSIPIWWWRITGASVALWAQFGSNLGLCLCPAATNLTPFCLSCCPDLSVRTLTAPPKGFWGIDFRSCRGMYPRHKFVWRDTVTNRALMELNVHKHINIDRVSTQIWYLIKFTISLTMSASKISSLKINLSNIFNRRERCVI